jgi:hypothetical protein
MQTLKMLQKLCTHEHAHVDVLCKFTQTDRAHCVSDMKSAKPKEENNPTDTHTCYAKCASQQKHNVHEVNTSTAPRNTANKVDSKSPAKGRTAISTEYDWTPQATLLHFLNRLLHAATSLTHATRLTHRHQSCLFLHFNSFSAAANAVASLLLVDHSGNQLGHIQKCHVEGLQSLL